MDERLDAEGFDFFLGVDAQFFADFDFDRQAVRVPARLAFAAVAAHGAVAGKQVLDRPRQAVAGMRHRRWPSADLRRTRTRRAGPPLQRLLVDLARFQNARISSSKAGNLTLLGTG